MAKQLLTLEIIKEDKIFKLINGQGDILHINTTHKDNKEITEFLTSALVTSKPQSTEQQCNIADVSSLACKHEWIMTADEFDQTCYCKKCGKSS